MLKKIENNYFFMNLDGRLGNDLIARYFIRGATKITFIFSVFLKLINVTSNA